eukprot:TRINITY_DN366_c0_g1_i1.p2 TRINITY_DN366_c0_g1~~TRINITY_DN366_c0_g1_i1.p2  ORF type:complete len:186 (+),score=5.17 TRINITY_DN366_c0_g1_i1:518-1075(+)
MIAYLSAPPLLYTTTTLQISSTSRRLNMHTYMHVDSNSPSLQQVLTLDIASSHPDFTYVRTYFCMYVQNQSSSQQAFSPNFYYPPSQKNFVKSKVHIKKKDRCLRAKSVSNPIFGQIITINFYEQQKEKILLSKSTLSEGEKKETVNFFPPPRQMRTVLQQIVKFPPNKISRVQSAKKKKRDYMH